MIKANTAAGDVSNEKEELDAKCRKRYQHYSDKKRAEIAKRAIDFGIIGSSQGLYNSNSGNVLLKSR